MAKVKVHVAHHFTVSNTHFYEVEVDIPNGLNEKEVRKAIENAEGEIRAMLRDGDQYHSVTNGEYDPYDGHLEFLFTDHDQKHDDQEEYEEEYKEYEEYEEEYEEECEKEEDGDGTEDQILANDIDRWSNDRIDFNMIRCPNGKFWKAGIDLYFYDYNSMPAFSRGDRQYYFIDYGNRLKKITIDELFKFEHEAMQMSPSQFNYLMREFKQVIMIKLGLNADVDEVINQVEIPKHLIEISKAFLIAETQVTQELWEKVMGWNPSHLKGNKMPVTNVTWFDCVVFCNKLSKLEGLNPCFSLSKIKKVGKSITSAHVEWLQNTNGYRLATEAEWEYSAKAGTELIYSGSNHIDDVAWYDDNSNDQLHEVKTKKPNAWGLYDMSGNVWEWCMDQWFDNAYQNGGNYCIEDPVIWSEDYRLRVLRGGSYWSEKDCCQVAYRNLDNTKSENYGFRFLRYED